MTKYSLLLKKTAGFTLIELLVVIAIIGILASVVLSSLGSARAAARDATIQSDIKNIQTALELFRNANNGLYPCHPSNTQVASMTSGLGCGNITPYISPIPNNPHPGRTGSRGYRYLTTGSRDTYTMLFQLNRNNFAWCSVSMGVGRPEWNGDPSDGGGNNYPPCF